MHWKCVYYANEAPSVTCQISAVFGELFKCESGGCVLLIIIDKNRYFERFQAENVDNLRSNHQTSLMQRNKLNKNLKSTNVYLKDIWPK